MSRSLKLAGVLLPFAVSLAACGGLPSLAPVISAAPASPPSESAPSESECIGYGCSPEQDEAINEAEREANAGN